MYAKNIYYFYYINVIGGIETFFYQLAKKYKDKDLIIVYRDGDPNQIKRLSKYVKTVKFTGQHFECENTFFNFNTDIIDYIDAKLYTLVLHGDYKAMIEQKQLDMEGLPIHPKIDKYIGVSQLVCDAWEELTGIHAELCYNPFELDPPKKVLNLISATRLTREKGKERMIKLGNMLNEAKIPYIWTIYTNDTNAIDNPNIVYKKPTLDIVNYINNADYLVQLSDNEGYCYSIIEALSCGTPVICTPCPVFPEIGLVNGENCYILDFDMKKVPINDIYNKIPKFTYKAKEDRWGELFAEGASAYQQDLKTKFLVKATNLYKKKKCSDVELNRIPAGGEVWLTSPERAKKLSALGYVTIINS